MEEFESAGFETESGDNAAATPEGEPTGGMGTDDEDGSEDENAEVQALLREARERDPEFGQIADRMHRSWQRGVTSKLQQRAELLRERELYKDLPPETAMWTKQLYDLSTRDPARAAAILQEEAARLRGTPPEPEPFGLDEEYLTDNERLLADRLRRMETQFGVMQQFKEQQERASVGAAIDKTFDGLEKNFGPITVAERRAVVQRMANEGAPPTATAGYWFDMNQERVMRQARRAGVETGARKSGLSPPPSSLTSREGDETPMPKTLREVLQRAAREG